MISVLLLLAALQQQSTFIGKHCVECHDADNAKGGLDLTKLPLQPADPKNFAAWVKVHDRVRDREMPP